MWRNISNPQMKLLLIMAVLLHTCHSMVVSSGELQYPLVLIPGSGGNQLEARLTAAYKPSSLLCRLSRKKDKWFRLWLDPTVLIAPLTRCFAERMTLLYDSEIDDYRNAPGVETRVPNFGSTVGLVDLDPHLRHTTEYMATLVASLGQIGYVDGCNLFGAPYDFRYGLAAKGHPSQVGTKYLQDLKALIETASASNSNKPVILLSHSLGSLFALQLLTRNPLAWRRRFVKHLITLSAPWGGTVQEMLTFASGNTLGVPLVNPLIVRGEQRSSECNLWLLPSPKLFADRPLVMTPNKNYSANQIMEFLEDIGLKDIVDRYKKRILPLDQLEEPGVPVTCVVGSEVDTPEALMYGSGGFDVQPEVVSGDGDGTVTMVSLLRLESEWSGGATDRQVVKVVKIPGVSHTDILKVNKALREIVGEILNINKVELRCKM